MTSSALARRLALEAKWIALLIAGLPHPGLAQEDVIRGKVLNDSGRTLPGVSVVVTMAPDRSWRQATTNVVGEYEIHFPGGSGDYLVYAALPGFRPFRKRVLRTEIGAPIVVDIQLGAEAVLLAAVRATAPRPRALPDVGLGETPTAGGAPSDLIGAMSPDQRGDLAALLSTLPGMPSDRNGAIAPFGLPSQVTTTLSGVSFASPAIPPDMLTRVRVITAAYDPSIGGFGAARINVEMSQGARVASTFARATIDPPVAPGLDRGSRTAVAAGASADGPFGHRDAWYNAGAQYHRSSTGRPSFGDASPNLLTAAGLAPDSAVRLRQAASLLGLPLQNAETRAGAVREDVSMLARLDRYRDPRRYGKLWTNALGLTAFAAFASDRQPGEGATVSPLRGANRSNRSGQLIGHWYHVSDSWASQLTTSVAASSAVSNPQIRIPSARVLVSSELTPGEVIQQRVELGGGSAASSSRALAIESTASLTFFASPSHRLKAFARALFDRTRAWSSGNANGTFLFQSLASFAANSPVQFSRSQSVPSGSASAVLSAFGIGDVWQVGPSFQLQPGLRVEATHFFDTGPADTALRNGLGLSSAYLPRGMHVSPRLGFVWTYSPNRAVGATGGATVGRILYPTRGVLSGGIGEFRSDIRSGDALGPARASRGDGATELVCSGQGAPTPDWRAYVAGAAVPGSCANGAPPTDQLSARSVEVFDEGYRQARSWRANLQWGGTQGALRYGVNAVYSLNLSQPGFIDANLVQAPAFVLPGEGDRPVFGVVTTIGQSSGRFAASATRRLPTFGSVSKRVSDLRSSARQLIVTLAPELPQEWNSGLSVAYSLSRIEGSTHGFDATTFSDPRAIEQSRSAFDVRHAFTVQAGYEFPLGIGLSLFASLRSGAPYSPMVGSDVNGDRLANDRAYVIDPSVTSDSNMARDMRSLLSSSPRSARECLARQLGSAAKANSCEGPWTFALNGALSTRQFRTGSGRIVSATMSFTNLPAALDALFHGAAHPRGWGNTMAPDNTLYEVVGFDSTSKQFLYHTNPRFGATKSLGAVPAGAYRIALSVRIELGEPTQRREFRRFLMMNPLRNDISPAPPDSVTHRLVDLVTDGYLVLIGRADSLLLTGAQIDTLKAMDRLFRDRLDSLWVPVALFVATHGTEQAIGEVNRRIAEAKRRSYEIQRLEVPRMLEILSPAQRDLARQFLKPITQSGRRLPPSYHIF